MGQRRMFSNRIANSAKFLQMPSEAQLLYFHMILRADDDGVVEAYPLTKLLGSPPDVMKVLLIKGFIQQLNEDQVVVITDWLEHNVIRADRKVDSIYKHLLPENIKVIAPKPRSDVVGGMRHTAIKESTSGLPYSFSYKIRKAFVGKPCPLCQKIMGDTEKNNTPSIQHNIPLSKGGKHELGNISVVCTHCNTVKKDTETTALNAKEVAELWKYTLGLTTDGISKVKLSKVKLNTNMSVFEDEFELFWSVYPKKELKKRSKEIWLSKKPPLADIISFIEKAKQSDRWRKGFIKQPPAFLNGECWNDDLSSYGGAQKNEVYKNQTDNNMVERLKAKTIKI